MITRVTIRNFKRIREAAIDLRDHIVFVGPNNSGKTTAIQALAVSEEGRRLFPQARWEVCLRAKNFFQIVTLAVSLGCHVVRVGFEDYFYLPNGEIAKHNVQLVESAVRIVKDLGRDIATVDEAREILSLPR